MTSRSSRFVQAELSTLILLVALVFPAPGWSQEQQPAAAPGAVPGTVSLPTATPAQAQTGIAAESTASATEQAGTYTIKEGDTLWDIASAHYRDPFLWPLIWKSNPSITDPDLIYPGNALVIPSLAPVERAMAEPREAEKPVQEQAAPAPVAAEPAQPSFFKKPAVESTVPEPEPERKLILPEETTPPLVDKYGMISAGFVSDEPSSDRLVESAIDPEKTLMGYDDEVFIKVKSRQDVKVGDRFLIYRPDHTVKHPVTNRSYGPMNIVLGILKVTAVRESGIHTARITTSFDDAERGDLLTPYQEPELLYPTKDKKTKDLSGYLLDVRDRRRINGQVDIVYLDKGKVDGVDPGDVFTVQVDNGSSTKILRSVGEVQVFLVKERTSTAVVRKSNDVIGRGDRFQFKN